MVSNAAPTKPEELAEEAYEHGQEPEFGEQVKRYIEKMSKDPVLQAELKDQREREMVKILREWGVKPEDRPHEQPQTETKTAGFDHLGDFVKALSPRAMSQGVDARLKDLSSADDGSFLIPEDFRTNLMSLSLENAIVRPRATVIPMRSSRTSIPTVRDTTHATSVFGGITASWTQEAGDISSGESDPSFDRVILTARKLTGYSVVPNELLQDNAAGLEAFIRASYPEAIKYFEDDAFINGTGVGQPLGVLNANALVTVAKETSQAATTIVYENIVNMFSRVLPQVLSRAVWIANIDTFPQLATMSLAVGTGGDAMWDMNAAGAPPTTILGRPVIYTEKAQTLGTAGDIMLVDFRSYLIGDRQSLSLASSDIPKFTTDQTVYRLIERVEGRPWITVALTPRNSSNTLSPFVALATRS